MKVPNVAAGTSGLHIEVQRGETVSGRVLHHGGTPVDHGSLTAMNLPPEGTKQKGRLHSVEAAISDGEFQATGLRPGRVQIRGRIRKQ